MRELGIKIFLLFFALSSLLFLSGIFFTLLSQSIPFFADISPVKFLTGTKWYPTHEPTPEFGILPLFLASLQVTLLAMIVAVPLSLGSAIFISELAPKALKDIIKPTIELFAGIPSVIYGFIGIVLIAPAIKSIFNLSTGLCALNASFILGFMALPTITSLAEDAISSVPRDIREASYALGSNHWETVIRAVFPYAKSGIYSAIILGFARAIGETMTVLMVAGGAAQMTHSYLKPVRPMTATIAAEMGEAASGSIHYHALFSIALVLFIITLGFNLISEYIRGRAEV
ncbi:MAG: phosphate ABC transporter permease subunit PstC [Candidatus Coatesbacteria bacterium 4484_99]|uniref:Phosphate transport system permease protein n=1 Tax=Candidatus Coatesbacteria bacterium 4484_99 TaxID=1970774 RepID=A0A1W9S063_9BACT|nr:MAG: phosphate ABC transporter permease subunit PstC [Candidatus Coatesbacteria bacterium 4484_99]RLC39990.1 MAG: phosphate ABC transporter permease subunit PstC [Candidatus Coatesbacteria bacterium]RLC42893.1 MAG: phosphate ABC transporter permease subunit PstC [Candidatus Coatesbacteria bacterium]RLC44663.1 MAG: phosphate ABC transporter permease subunit PstC [Candidatus Coatesbacteria bacterium]